MERLHLAELIKFGTDGWRGIIAEDFTFDNVRACAQGVANYLTDSGLAAKGLLIGYDTRFASEHFAAASADDTTPENLAAIFRWCWVRGRNC